MKIRRIYYITWLVFLLLENKVYCQKVLYPEINPVDARFDQFLIMNGKAAQAALSLMNDSRGFMWFGTENGLYRFDGSRYVAYGIDSHGDKGFSGYQVNTIFEDSDGIIWAGTSGALNRLDQNTGRFSHFFPDSLRRGSGDNVIRFIAEDRKGFLWIITDLNIFRFNRISGSFTNLGPDSLVWRKQGKSFYTRDESERFLEDYEGNIWIGTDNGLYFFGREGNIPKRIYPTGNDYKDGKKAVVNCVKQDAEGNIWSGTLNDGLLAISGQSPGAFRIVSLGNNGTSGGNVTAVLPDTGTVLWVFKDHLLHRFNYRNPDARSFFFSDRDLIGKKWNSSITIEKMFKKADGSLWFLYMRNGQLFRFDPVSEKLSLYHVPSFTVVQCIIDNTGSLWFGCVRYNVFRLASDPLTIMKAVVPNESDVNAVHKVKMIEDSADRFWLLLSTGTFYVQSYNVHRCLAPKMITFPSDEFKAVSIIEDRNGIIWFGGTRGQVCSYDPESKNLRIINLPIKEIPEDYLLPQVNVMTEAANGDVYISTIGCGIFVKPSGTQLIMPFNQRISLSCEMDFSYITDMRIEGDDLWVAGNSGLFRINTVSGFVSEFTDFGGTTRDHFDITLRLLKVGNDLWALNTFSGLYRIDPGMKSFVKVFPVEGSAGNVYYDVVSDSLNRFWISRNNEIVTVDTLRGIAAVHTFGRIQYDIQSLRLKSGCLAFLNEYELVLIREMQVINRRVPPVRITALMVNNSDSVIADAGNNPHDVPAQIDLKHSQRNLRFEFAALDYLDPAKNTYRYILEGYDDDTTWSGVRNYAEYRNLPPGKYTFRVSAANNDGIWNNEGASFDFEIHPPLYGSAGAKIAYALIFMAALAGYVKWRTRHLETDKERLEAIVRQKTRLVEEKNRQLEETDRLKTAFFTDISHEIRTPLSLILAPLETIAREMHSNLRIREIIEVINRNGQRLMSLIEQLLDISRLDAGKMKLTLREEDILKSIRILVYEFLSLAEQKSISYLVDIPDGEFITSFDRDKTEKIISNLLSNAFKFTPEEGAVSCTVTLTEFVGHPLQRILNIKVKDSGIGILPEYHSRIFDRFFRIEEKKGFEYQGTGIGLSLIRDYVSLMHGTVGVDSKPGEGSEFTVSLPLGKEHLGGEEYIVLNGNNPAQHIRANFEPESLLREQDSDHHGRSRILLVEDNADLRDYISTNLPDYIVFAAGDGKTGLNMASTTIPDLIITDIMMPGMDGITLCRHLKTDVKTSHIPVLMLTARTTMEDKLEGLKSGADGYINKPFSVNELKYQISNLFTLQRNIRAKYSNLSWLENEKETIRSADDLFMEKVVKLLNSNLRDFNFGVNAMKESLGLSRTHLYRKIKALTGQSPVILVRNLRLEKAKNLLESRSGNITEIAYSVGFSNPSYFAKAFREYFGITPKAYMKMHK